MSFSAFGLIEEAIAVQAMQNPVITVYHTTETSVMFAKAKGCRILRQPFFIGIVSLYSSSLSIGT